ncbi:LysR family transcriptional regulator [Paenibacillus guangzhouensis]|uniref:LysR family transcriptional regulator n=1 Tax=Paenibacillus guangzhouensis TaxID=1473112 RepID=UPI0012668B58|nr:LysR family transcriptional regulator [Paenibacillus guangzhouensis]
MELLQLQYFRTVARLEHMTRAAQELRVAQPALSKTIARLEEDVGVPLFDRLGRQIKLNMFGRVFLEKAEAALHLLEEGKRQVNDMAGMAQGSIYVATPTMNRLSSPVGAFLAKFPDIQFHLSQTTTEEIPPLLESGQIDFSFSGLPINRPGIYELPIMKEEVFLAVPSNHKFAERTHISMQEVANEPFIGYKLDHVYRQRDDDIFKRAGLIPNYVCDVNEPSAKLSLIRAGLGIAFIGACNKSDDASLGDLTLLTIDSPSFKSSFQLAWHEKHYLSRAAQAFRDFIIAYYQNSEPLQAEQETTPSAQT